MLVGQIEDEFINGVTDSRALDPSAYHITHEGNLDKLFELGCLFCDSHVRQHVIPHIQIGYKHTKLNRLGSGLDFLRKLE